MAQILEQARDAYAAGRWDDACHAFSEAAERAALDADARADRRPDAATSPRRTSATWRTRWWPTLPSGPQPCLRDDAGCGDLGDLGDLEGPPDGPRSCLRAQGRRSRRIGTYLL